MSRFELEHINTLWFMTLGVTAISAGVLVYVLLLESALGAFSIREFYPVINTRNEGPRIAVLYSNNTLQLGNNNDGQGEALWYKHLMDSWKSYVDSSAFSFNTEFVDDVRIETGDLLADYDVVMLPAAHALSDVQVEEISTFLAEGGSVYASWKMGYYRPDGTVRGWDVVETLFGVEHVADVDRTEGTYRAFQRTFPGEVEPGIYLPVNNVLSGIAESDFKPLSGYRRVAALDTPPPRSDHAQASVSTQVMRNLDGDSTLQSAVTVNYYSWLGDTSGRKMPYPYAGFGMEQISFLGSTPLTRNIPAGFGLFVQVYDPAARLKIVNQHTYPITYWSDWAQSLNGGPISDHSSAVYGTFEKGRFVYTGFRRDALGVGQVAVQDIVLIERFFQNIVSFLRKKPAVWLSDWPAPYNAGALLSGLGKSNPEYLLPLADSLKDEGVEGTFFIEPTQADLHRSLVLSLKARGEIGVYDDYSDRESYDSFFDLQDRFTNLREVMEEIADEEVLTYRSSKMPNLKVDTQKALAKSGYTSLYSDSLERRALPIVSRFTTPRLTRFPVTAWTDHELIAAYPDREIDFTAVELDIQRMAQEAGIYQFIYSTEGVGRPEYRYLLPRIVRSLKENRYWIATSTQMTKWWRERNGIKVAMDRSGKSRLVLHISNQNGELVDQVGVFIDLGSKVEGVRIRPELISSAVPRHELRHDNSLLYIKIKSLKPQQTRLFHIDLIFEDSLPLIAEKDNGSQSPTTAVLSLQANLVSAAVQRATLLPN